jgi:5-methylcytosine-specific restriction enzyme A
MSFAASSARDGDINEFWLGPFMSLCKRCHDSTKGLVEIRGYRPEVGRIDGLLDPLHPVNQKY